MKKLWNWLIGKKETQGIFVAPVSGLYKVTGSYPDSSYVQERESSTMDEVLDVVATVSLIEAATNSFDSLSSFGDSSGDDWSTGGGSFDGGGASGDW